MFEQNNVYIDYSENLFTFHKVDNEENKYISFKKIIKLLHCYNDYTQNFNSLEEVQKAFR